METATKHSAAPTLTADAYVEFVCLADEIIRRALRDLPLSPHSSRLLNEIRARTVERLCSAEIKYVVGKATARLGAENQLHVSRGLRELARESAAETCSAPWRGLDVAREVLHHWLILSDPDVPGDVRAILMKFDMLLRGGIGDSCALGWPSLASANQGERTRP